MNMRHPLHAHVNWNVHSLERNDWMNIGMLEAEELAEFCTTKYIYMIMFWLEKKWYENILVLIRQWSGSHLVSACVLNEVYYSQCHWVWLHDSLPHMYKHNWQKEFFTTWSALDSHVVMKCMPKPCWSWQQQILLPMKLELQINGIDTKKSRENFFILQWYPVSYGHFL